MDNQVSDASSALTAVPDIVVTEPSPLVQSTAVSVAQKAEFTPEETASQDLQATENVTAEAVETVQTTSEQGTSVPEPVADSSGEFTSAQECNNECIIPISEPPESQLVEDTTATSETDQDDFRIAPTGRYLSFGMTCLEIYRRLWNIMNSAYAIPVWLLLLSLPLSAGIMGALYLFSCPAAPSMATLTFFIGITLMALIALRVCFIIHRMTSDAENSRNILRTLLLVNTFLTVLFFITESVSFWRMSSTSHPGTSDYCDPHFLTYSFWWNCVMCVAMVPISMFPA